MTATGSWPLDAGTSTLEALSARLHSYFARSIPSAELAEDLVQDTWVAAAKYRGEAPLHRYLLSVARRLTANWYRERSKARPVKDPAAVLEIAHVDESSLASLLARIDDLNELDHAVAALPELYRRPMQLWLVGMSGKEIAATLGLSPHTVRSRLSRARDQIQDTVAARRRR